jgi:hypothetical protein
MIRKNKELLQTVGVRALIQGVAHWLTVSCLTLAALLLV